LRVEQPRKRSTWPGVDVVFRSRGAWGSRNKRATSAIVRVRGSREDRRHNAGKETKKTTRNAEESKAQMAGRGGSGVYQRAEEDKPFRDECAP